MGIQQGPSSITVEYITGGSAHTTLTTPGLVITQVRLLGYKSSRLLLIMENQNYGASVSIDTSQNGLWKMNTDGSGLTSLTTEGANTTSNLNRFTQYRWSNVSFDGSLYALQVTDIQSKETITRLLYGSLSGGAPTSFAFVHANTGTVEVAGWTMDDSLRLQAESSPIYSGLSLQGLEHTLPAHQCLKNTIQRLAALLQQLSIATKYIC